MTLQQQLESGLAHYHAGRLAEAEMIYRQILTQQPNHPEALYLLGVLAGKVGRNDIAEDLIRRAIAFRPNYAEAHSDLGNVLMDRGQLDEAIAAYRQAIALNPNLPEANANLGNALRVKGEFDEAIAACRRAIALRPDFAHAHCNLGNALLGKGRLDEAIASYRQAIRLKPDDAGAYSNLGVALKDLGQLEEAIASFRRAIRLKPDLAKAHDNLGNALKDIGQLDEAIASHRYAIRLKPDDAEAHYNLGIALHAKGQPDEAIGAYRQAIGLRRNYAEAQNNLGNALKDSGQLDEATASYRQAVRLKPDDAAAHSNLVFALHFHPGYDARMIHEEASRWNQQHAEPLKKLIGPHTNNRDPDRRLRIGYVSPDFYLQAECFFVLPLLQSHDRRNFEIHCYSSVLRPDDITRRFKEHADVWHDVAAETDDRLAERIRRDQIDILIDLTMHMRNNRLLLFARKPAPVQVTWLAYPGGTGLPAIDYRLTDALLDPPDSDSYYAERSIRLPGCWCCYDPLSDAAIESPPRDFVRFASLNNPVKLNDSTLALWSGVLQAVPGSRLLLLAISEDHRGRIRRLLADAGIGEDRLEFTGYLPRPSYLKLYNTIDACLDPLPYSGITTTLDALWMGVPVVTLVGQTASGRAGLSILTAAGMPELVAKSPEEFVAIAARAGEYRPEDVRRQFSASSLMDAPRFARNVEAAYRQMWRNWCEKGGVSGLQCQAT
jgi:predicted O-linked N-acetylglucosamine transferase (SPINDLY family)